MAAAKVVEAAACYSCVLDDCGLVCKTYDELRVLIERLGQTRHMGTMKRHATYDEAYKRIWQSGVPPIRKFVSMQDNDGKVALTPRQRAIVRLARVGAAATSTEITAAHPQQQQQHLSPSTSAHDSAQGHGAGVEAEEAAAATTSMELRIEKRPWPHFAITLFNSKRILYARTDTLACRREWRYLTNSRARNCAILIDALNTELGMLATAIRLDNLDLFNSITRYVFNWRLNAGRNARNMEIPNFDILDELRTLIDSRTLNVFLSSAATPSSAASGSEQLESRRPEAPSATALSSRPGPPVMGAPLPPGSASTGPTRKRSKAQGRTEARET
jgi:hypothetical protein